MAILPYMRQLPQDYYDKNYVPPTPTVVPTTPPTVWSPSVPVPVITDPINEGGVWIGTIYPSNPGEGWLFFDTNSNNLYIYTDSNWEVVASPSSAGVTEAPTDGGTYARRNAAWTEIYDGGAY